MATRAISRLQILIGATTTGLTQGLAKAKSQVAGFDAAMERTFGPSRVRAIRQAWTSVQGAILATTAALAVAIVGFNNARSEIDAIAKSSAALGISIQNFQALELGADLTGTSLESVEGGLRRMTRVLSDARAGLTSAQRPLTRLRLDLDDLLEASPDEAFERIAKAISEQENATIRAATAQEIFGRRGAEMLNLLEFIGKRGLEPLREELRRLGIDLDDIDAQKVQDMNDSVTRAERAWKGARDELLAFFAPTVQQNAERLTNVLAGLNKIGNDVNTWLGEANERFDRWKNALERFDPAFSPGLQQLSNLMEMWGLSAETDNALGLKEAKENMDDIVNGARELQSIEATSLNTISGLREADRLAKATIL